MYDYSESFIYKFGSSYNFQCYTVFVSLKVLAIYDISNALTCVVFYNNTRGFLIDVLFIFRRISILHGYIKEN